MITMPRHLRHYWLIFLFILLAVILFLLPQAAFPTTVMGVAKVQGTPLTGFVDVSLVYPGTNGSYISLPGGSGHKPVTNGAFDAFVIEGNDTLLPRGTYYQFLYSDAYGNGIARLNYVITGSTFDIGTAVPTPVTTNNVNFLDLIGLRNVSTNNLTVLGNFTLGLGGMTLSPAGIGNAKMINDFRYATAYTGSSTCGIQEAINSLPSGGGTVYLPIGSCVVSTTIAPGNKSITFIGHGIFSSSLNWTGGANNVFLITNTAHFSSFSIVGTGTGTGINIEGSSTATVFNVGISDIAFGDISIGTDIGDYGTGTLIRGSSYANNVNYGIVVQGLTGPNVGTSIRDTVVQGNGGDGIFISGIHTIDVSISNVTLQSNLGAGVEVTSSAGNNVTHILSSTITDNHIAGVTLSAGFGHTIDASQIVGGAHQLVGVTLNYAGPTNKTQLEVKDSNIVSNLTNDLVVGSAVTDMVIYPPTTELVGMNNAIDPAAGVKYVTAQAAPAVPTCGGSGCWSIRPDGFMEQWGIVGGCTTSGGPCSVVVNFPRAFSSTSGLNLQHTCTNWAPGNCVIASSSFGTGGFTANFNASVRVSGSGGELNSSEAISWWALGPP